MGAFGLRGLDKRCAIRPCRGRLARGYRDWTAALHSDCQSLTTLGWTNAPEYTLTGSSGEAREEEIGYRRPRARLTRVSQGVAAAPEAVQETMTRTLPRQRSAFFAPGTQLLGASDHRPFAKV